MANPTQPIIIKKIKKTAHAHHGGAWKIAYADFVTAMMAFFLLMWLINMTSPEQKIGLAEYFAPGDTRGAGGILMGTALDNEGAKSSASPRASRGPAEQDDGTRPTNTGQTSDRNLSRPAADEHANQNAMTSIRQALQKMPDIAELSNNIMIEQTEEGVNVSLVDEDGRSMFSEGSTRPHERTRRALEALVPALRELPNRLSVTGHTATGLPGSVEAADPWSLTTGRSLAVREILLVAGLPKDHFASVAGRADTEPLYPDNPHLAPNRRVTITLLNAAPPLPPSVVP
jgi:chemotaxis protein MotB